MYADVTHLTYSNGNIHSVQLCIDPLRSIVHRSLPIVLYPSPELVLMLNYHQVNFILQYTQHCFVGFAQVL